MKFLFAMLIISSFFFAILTNRMEELSQTILTQAIDSVYFSISIIATMMLWGGIMEIAKKSGLITIITKLFSPLIQFIFKGLDKNSEEFSLISMNFTANLLGISNASTPIAISAMKKLQESNCDKSTATNHMILLVVLNTASIQLIPTTIATLRGIYGSVAPMDIIYSVFTVSMIALIISIACCKALMRKWR